MDTYTLIVTIICLTAWALCAAFLIISDLRWRRDLKDRQEEDKQAFEILNNLSNICYIFEGWNIEININPTDEGYICKARKDNVEITDYERLNECYYSEHYGMRSIYCAEKHRECVSKLKDKIERRIWAIERLGFENWKKENFPNGNK